MTDKPHMSRERLVDEVERNPLWYHTMDLGQGVVTPGWFDLRPVVDRLPWPDVRGKRCLDVGTYDGFLAFELERRGASEVVATDISDHEQWDWPLPQRRLGPDRLAELAGEKGHGFEIAKETLGSQVRKVEVNVYDLSPEDLGTFDVVVCGSLLLHLRDPLRALEAIRSVCHDLFLSSEQIDIELTLMHPRQPLLAVNGLQNMQWQVPNTAGHRRLIRAGGFEVMSTTRPYAIRFGTGHPPLKRTWSRMRRNAVSRLLAGTVGVPHAAVLGRVGSSRGR